MIDNAVAQLLGAIADARKAREALEGVGAEAMEHGFPRQTEAL